MRPPADVYPVVRGLLRLGGAARWNELLSMGVTAGQVRSAVARGTVQRSGFGVYCLPDVEAAMLAASRFRASCTCVTALEMWGLPVMDPVVGTHLAVGQDQAVRSSPTRPTAGIVLHRGESRVAPQGPLQTVPIPAALVHASQCLTRRSLVSAADAALNAGLMDIRELEAMASRHPRLVGALPEWCDPKAQSPIESITRLDLTDAGLRLLSQVNLPGVGLVDFVVEDQVVVETDGREHHEGWAAQVNDRRRDRAIQELGLDVARFTFAEVMHRPGYVVDEVERLLERSRVGSAVVRT